MMKGVNALSRIRPATAVMALTVALFLAACGGADEPTPTPTLAPPDPTPTPTDAPTGASGGETSNAGGGWLMTGNLGGRVGNSSHNPILTLRDGSMETLEEAAGGKAVLLYFFETW